jgi:hypothetical protein
MWDANGMYVEEGGDVKVTEGDEFKPLGVMVREYTEAIGACVEQSSDANFANLNAKHERIFRFLKS